MDIVIPVRRGANEELRYALRAIAANVQHDRVWIFGRPPSWLTGCEVIDVEQAGTKYETVRRARRQAAEHPDVSDTFAWWNDDMFAVSRVDEIKTYNRGTIADVIVAYENRGMIGGYLAGMRQTRKLLREWGHEEPLSFELHVPMLFEKGPLLEVMDRVEDEGLKVPHIRSIYGNEMGLVGETIEDVKIYDVDQVLPRGPWISSADKIFRYGVGNLVRWLFPDPCRFERTY